MTVKLLLETFRADKVEKFVREHLARACADAQRRGRRGVVVFDIDGTMVREDRREATPIIAMRNIYKAALRHGCALYIVTARPNMRRAATTVMGASVSNLELTRRELAKAGYDASQFRQIHMLPANASSDENYSRYKAERRSDSALDAGEPLVLNVGDQFADLMLLPPFRKTMPTVVLKNGTRARIVDLNPRKYFVLSVQDAATPCGSAVISVKLPDRLTELPPSSSTTISAAAMAANSTNASSSSSSSNGTGAQYRASAQRVQRVHRKK